MTPHIANIAKNNTDNLGAFAVALYEARESFKLITDEDQKVFSDIIHHLFAAVAANTSFNLDVSKHWIGYVPSADGSYTFIARHDSAFDLVKLALSFGAESLSLCKRVMIRLKPLNNTNIVQWFTSWVDPFVRKIRPLLEKNNLDLTNDVFRTFIVTNVELLVKALGKKPHETVPKGTLEKFGCDCEYCQRVKVFLLSSGLQKEISAKEAHRRHVEKELVQAGALTWGL